MQGYPTVRPCVAPIQFLCHDYSSISLPSLDVEGGTVLFFETGGRRFLITARHVWDGIVAMSGRNAGRMHGAFVYAGKFFPLRKTEPTRTDDTLDVVAMAPAWIPTAITGYEFYKDEPAPVSAGDAVTTWGFPGARRTRITDVVSCPMERLEGIATAPCDGRFKFLTTAAQDLGGFSGAPVFRSDGTLVGLVSEASAAFGIVTCCELGSFAETLHVGR